MIFHSSTNGIRIINTDDSDIEMVYHHFFKHSTHFSILEFIFFNEGCQAESICKEFYISSSSLYRIISQINKVIKRQFQFEVSLTLFKSLEMRETFVTFLHNIFQKNIIS